MLSDPISAARSDEDPDLLCGTDFRRNLIYGVISQHLQGFLQTVDKQLCIPAVDRVYHAYKTEFQSGCQAVYFRNSRFGAYLLYSIYYVKMEEDEGSGSLIRNCRNHSSSDCIYPRTRK